MSHAIVNCVHAPLTAGLKIRCSLGLHGGSPSPGVCELLCKSRLARDGSTPTVTYVQVVARHQPAYKGGHEWRALHRRALLYRGDAAIELQYLDGLAARLPCGECRQHFNTWRRMSPPALRDAGVYFAWTVRLHNSVRTKLGQRRWTAERARRRWSSRPQ